jgi:hypothetical protein
MNSNPEKEKKLLFRSVIESDSLKDLYQFVEADCQNMLESPQDSSTKRFLIMGIEYLIQKSQRHEVASFFNSLKLLARSSHTIFVISLDPRNLSLAGQSCQRMIENYFDFVLEFLLIHSKTLLTP